MWGRHSRWSVGNPFDADATVNKKRGPEGPERGWLMDLLGVAVVVAVRWQYDQPAVDREGFQFDRESGSSLVREGGADLDPAFPRPAVALELFDGENVEVGERLGGCRFRCRSSVGLLFGIVHVNTLSLIVWLLFPL